MKTVFVTKWLETRGIVELKVIRFDGLGVLVRLNNFGHSGYIGKNHWFGTMEQAEDAARKIATKRIATHEKKIAELKKWLLAQEGQTNE